MLQLQRRRFVRIFALACVYALLLGFVRPARAGIFEGHPDNYLTVVRALRAGDELRLSPGEYKQGLSIHQLVGGSNAPIVIAGPSIGAPALFPAQSGRNTISIANSAHVALKNLVLDGHGLPVDGVKCEGHADFAHHITLENLTIRGHGNNQQTVGISTKCPAWNWVIRDNVIIGAGTGMYLGNSDGSDPFVAGLIEHNLIVDSIGYNLQIKHQAVRPALAGIPSEPSETVIRHNVFAKTAPFREGAQPRPSVLVGHWPKIGAGKDDRYLIHGNFFYGNAMESLFQGEGNIALYNNLFVAPDRDAIRIQPHNDIPKNVAVIYNTILARGAGVVIAKGEDSDAYEQVVSRNAIFGGRPLMGVLDAGNVVGSWADAERYLINPFALPGDLDLRPLPGALHLRGPAPSGLLTLPDMDSDFDGARRDLRVVGAYGKSGGVLRWPPRLERKPRL